MIICLFSIDANEENKSYRGVEKIIDTLIRSNFRKNHRLIGIGGGIVQDITAFTASVMYRGVEWIFFPTTLLAQGDSCIGSKTSINFGKFKNQIGGFYPPKKIFIDTCFLDTLSNKDLQSGFGEMCHYFIIAGEKQFYEYKDNYKNFSKDNAMIKKMLFNSLNIKKKYVEIDEFDTNERKIFNYGHSFGHAIESMTKYSIPHGIAVSIGMDMANFISFKFGFLNEKIRHEIRDFLKKIWKGYSIKNLDLKGIL